MKLALAFALCAAALPACLSDEPEDGADEVTLPDEPTDVARSSSAAASVVLFDGGTGGYHSYRIPSIVRTTADTLIAFAEGRRSSAADYGDINIVARRSGTDGKTWAAQKDVVGTGHGTWGNPTAVVDPTTGRIWLFASWNAADVSQHGDGATRPVSKWGDRRVYSMFSDNDGKTWSKPVDRTAQLTPKTYTWDAVGPGIGIRTATGRLVIPALGRFIYSDDHGATWQYVRTPGGTSESTVVELLDGSLLRNDRATPSKWDLEHRRWTTRGTIEDGFSALAADAALLDPKCEGSILRYTRAPSRILFLNPASTVSRCKMRVRVSYDEGRTWPISRGLYDGTTDPDGCDTNRGGYSSLVKTADSKIGVLSEINEGAHRSLVFHKLSLSWVLDGKTEPTD